MITLWDYFSLLFEIFLANLKYNLYGIILANFIKILKGKGKEISNPFDNFENIILLLFQQI